MKAVRSCGANVFSQLLSVGLKININKTKVISIGTKNAGKLFMNGEELKKVEEFYYLSRIIRLEAIKIIF